MPYDPYMDNVFDGEEGTRGVRFFTFGYDVYAPDDVLVTHDYNGHQGNPVVHSWGKNGGGKGLRGGVELVGRERANVLLGIEDGEEGAREIIRRSRYGLGDKRTLEQAEKFMGVDFGRREMVKNMCGNLVWVPFEEPKKDYGVGETLRRGLWGETVIKEGPLGGNIMDRVKDEVKGGGGGGVHFANQIVMMIVCGAVLAIIIIVRGSKGKTTRRKL